MHDSVNYYLYQSNWHSKYLENSMEKNCYKITIIMRAIKMYSVLMLKSETTEFSLLSIHVAIKRNQNGNQTIQNELTMRDERIKQWKEAKKLHVQCAYSNYKLFIRIMKKPRREWQHKKITATKSKIECQLNFLSVGQNHLAKAFTQTEIQLNWQWEWERKSHKTI